MRLVIFFLLMTLPVSVYAAPENGEKNPICVIKTNSGSISIELLKVVAPKTVQNFIEKLNPNFIIERFAGEVPPRFQAGPGWGLTRNERIVELVEAELERRDSFQGKDYTEI